MPGGHALVVSDPHPGDGDPACGPAAILFPEGREARQPAGSP